MKKIKVIMSLLMALVLSLSLVSCKSSEEIAATPQGTVIKKTLDALLAGDYDTANANIMILGAEENSSTVAYGASLPKVIFDGLEYEFKDIKVVKDAIAVVKVKFKVYDHMEAFHNWFDDISILTLINSSVEESLSDLEFSEASMDRLEKQLKETKAKKRTVTSEVQVQKTDDGWKIIYSDAFIDNTTGGFATAIKGITQQIQDMASSQISE